MKRCFFSFLILCLCILNSTCKKNNNNIICPLISENEDCSWIYKTVHDESSTILGKWKLMIIRDNPFNPKCLDYCQYNIVFEFKTNNVVTISGNTELPNLFFIEDGDNLYSFVEFDWFDNASDKRRLSIGKASYYWYKINSEELVFDSSPVDGSMLYFIKIK